MRRLMKDNILEKKESEKIFINNKIWIISERNSKIISLSYVVEMDAILLYGTLYSDFFHFYNSSLMHCRSYLKPLICR